MTKNDFLTLFSEKLQLTNKNLTCETRLDSLNEWDSWAKLDIMSLVDETLQVNLTSEDLNQIETLGDLMNKIGENKFDK